MTIGIVTGFSYKRAAGLEQFLMDLLEHMELVRPKNVEYVIYTSKKSDIEKFLQVKELQSFKVIKVGFGSLWKYVGLPFVQRSDVYLWNGPLVSPFFFPKKSTVLVYDFAYREMPHSHLNPKDRLRIVVMDALSRFAFAHAAKIFPISQATADVTEKLFGTAPSLMSVIPPGVRDIRMVSPKEVGVPSNGYFFFVGTFKERKNVRNLVEGYIKAAKDGILQDLVLAGKMEESSEYVQGIRNLVKETDMEGRVHFLGQVSDNELAFLYSHATAFTFISTLEGFGMPILEAMSCGVPVLTSTVSSLPEVAGDAAMLVDPYDIAKIADALMRLSTDENLRTDLIGKGRARFLEFSWKASAQKLVDELVKIT